MVMSSSEISALTGSFQAQNMGMMQHAAMISHQAGMTTGERAMGRMTNMGAAIGSPLITGGMALAGLDPFSMGMSGAMAGFARGGVMGAVGGGLMGAGMVGLPMMAAQFAGSQMLQGVQQQQMLGAGLRSSFNFMGQTGRGFTSGEIGNIGASFRQMAAQRGPGGEMTNFDELGRLAANMGRMGMAQGVRNAREFQDKFQEMMKSVKEIATAFSTSLEQAQQIMGSMRSSGIFKGQGAISQQIKNFAQAGGLGLSEVTGAMSTGSQISRMIGGRGRAGAMGGMQTIGQIGIAQQMGTMSEEDIYNATGLTGAEGRQALATNMMQTSARFLQGGLGRRFIAAMAGKGGRLDEASVEEFMNTDVSTGRTMEMAHANLAKTGRADFIRNEGKLRGEVLGRMGGLAPMIAMRGWLQNKGFDLSSGQDDRAQIFLQRRLGIGEEEASLMVKQARDLPMLMRQKDASAEDAQFMGRLENQRSKTGLEGIKRNFEDARNDVQLKLQQVGADFYQSGSNMIERWVNKLTGDYVRTVDRDIGSAVRDAMSGNTSISSSTLRSRFGIGGGLHNESARQDIFGGGGRVSDVRTFERSGDLAAFRDAGYNISASSDKGLSAQLQNVQRIQEGFATGAGAAYEKIGAGASGDLRMALATGAITGRGTDRLRSISNFLSSSGNDKLAALSDRFSSAGDADRAKIYGSLMRGAGVGGEASLINAPEAQSIFGQGGFATESDRSRAIGGYMLKHSGMSSGMDAFVQSRLNVVSKLGSSWLTGKVREMYGGASGETEEAAGRFLSSEKGRDLSSGVLSEDMGVRAKATDEIMERNIRLVQEAGGISKLSRDQMGEFEANKSMLMAAGYADLMAKTGGQPSDREKADLLRKTPGAKSWADLEARAGSVMGSRDENQKGARRELYRRLAETGRKASLDIAQSGLIGEGGNGLSASAMQAFKGGSAGEAFVQSMIKGASAMGRITGIEANEGADSMARQEAAGENQEQSNILAGMSVKEKRELAAGLSGFGGAGAAAARAEALGQAGIQAKLDSTKNVSERQAQIARLLGTGLTAKDLKGKSAEEVAARISQETGVNLGTEAGAGFKQDLVSALTSAGTGKTGEAAGLARKLQVSGVLSESLKNRQDAAQEQNDPSFRRLGEIKKALEDMPKAFGGQLRSEPLKVTMADKAEK